MHRVTPAIGHRLRLARKQAGFKTAREFAAAHTLAQSTYSQYETGKRAFNADVMARFCQLLELNAHWLLFGSGEPFNFTAPAAVPVSEPTTQASSTHH